MIVDDTVKRVMLFEPSAAGFVPMTDEMLCHTVASGLGIENLGEYEFADLKCIVESDEKGNKVLEEARLIYRAIGRIMANCLATGNVISPTALPKLFRNGASHFLCDTFIPLLRKLCLADFWIHF